MEKSILDYIADTAVSHKKKVAFCDTNNKVTFDEVNTKAKGVGTYLCDITVPNSPVIVLSGRNVYTPIAYLGVAFAGCFYIPLDATVPPERLRTIVSLSEAETMIVESEFCELAEQLSFSGRTVILEDIIDTVPDEAKLHNAVKTLNEEAPLYVIYTSGSTGVPKGVITSHHSVMCYIDSVCKVLEITDDDILGNQSPLDYIASIRDIYIPLKTGASTVIIPKEQFAMVTDLIATLNEYKVTTLCWSVAGVELLSKLNAFKMCIPKYVKKVIFSGSAISCKHLKNWQTYLPHVKYINQYGPTEATASCTYYVVENKVEDTDVLPIGTPYDNYKITLISPDGTATPTGEIGEICVSGPILALGYYNDEERTRKSFIQNPLNRSYRELIYKTGDLGRIREDGLLEFHGRNDRQVKFMGHRVELDEIDAFAKQLDDVIEVASAFKNEKLCLFYTGSAEKRQLALEFRRKMPSFMVPSKFVMLESFPTLPNGKINYKKLEEMI